MSTELEQPTSTRTVGSAITIGLLIVGAWIAIAAGLGCAVFAAAGQAGADVPVRLGTDAPATSTMVVPCVEGWPEDGSAGCEPAASPDEWRGGEPLPVTFADGMMTGINDVPPLATLLSMSPLWAALLTVGGVVLVLVPVVRSTLVGRLFQPGNDRRLAVAAAVVVLGWVVATAGPALAAPTVLELVEAAPRYTWFGPLETFDMPAGWLVFDLRITWWPLLPALMLAGLAGATRAGTRVVADTEGLV